METVDFIRNKQMQLLDTTTVKHRAKLLYEHYKTPSKAIMWFYEGLHSEFE